MTPPASQSRWQLAFASAGAGAWEWNLRTGRVSWSTPLEELHGLRKGSFPGTLEANEAFVHPADRERVLAALREGADGRPARIEYRILRLDGGIRWVESRNQVVADESGQPAYLLGLCFDVTEARATAAERFNSLREKMDDLARRSREALGVLVAHNPEALFVRRGDIVLFANDALARLAGMGDGSALAGASVLGLVAPEDRDAAAWMMSGAEEGRAALRVRLQRPDGTRVAVELREGTPAAVDGQDTVAVSARLAEEGDPELARDAERVADRALATRELLDRALAAAQREGVSPRVRGVLDELAARLADVHQGAARLSSSARSRLPTR